MPLSKAHPFRDIHASRSWNWRSRFYSSNFLPLHILSALVSRPHSLSPSFFQSPFYILSFCNSLFPSRLIAEPPAARTFPRDEQYFPPSRLLAPFPIGQQPTRSCTSRKDWRSIKRLVRSAPTNVRRTESAVKTWNVASSHFDPGTLSTGSP